MTESWDYIQVASIAARSEDFKDADRWVSVAGDWSFTQDRFDRTGLPEMLSWLGKAGWELVSNSHLVNWEDGKRYEEEVGYMRRPTRFASSP